MKFYHGGIAGLNAGDMLVPSPPHVSDGCPVCVARAGGRSLTVGEYRVWLRQFGDRALPILRQLRDAPDDAPMDPPSERDAVYFTSELDYATWYAARSCGDLYQVEPVGPIEKSGTDHFPSFTAPAARVIRVIRRGVRLTRSDRRRIGREWEKADRRAERADFTSGSGSL